MTATAAPTTAAIPGAEPVRPRLAALARTARLAGASRGLLAAGAAIAATAGGLVALDAVAPLPSGLRLAGLAGLGVLAAAMLWHAVRAARAVAPETIALRVEAEMGLRDNAVINACQFEAMAAAGSLRPAEARWLAPTGQAAGRALANVPTGALVGTGRLLRALAAASAAAALVAAAAVVWPDHLRHGALRLVLPLADLPPLGGAVLAVEPSGRPEIQDGGTLVITVAARAADRRRGVVLPAPVVRWADGLAALPAEPDAGEALTLTASGDNRWSATLPDLHRALSLRAWCAGTASPAVVVAVQPPPRLTRSVFIVDGPAYAGIAAEVRPGPPAAVSALPGARLSVEVACERRLPALRLELPGAAIALTVADGRWTGAAVPAAAGAYRLVVPAAGGSPEQVLARGEFRVEADLPPEATLGGAERNRFVDPGTRLELPVGGSDDRGLAGLAVEVREAVEGSAPRVQQAWTYLGPPGPRQSAEVLRLDLDPAVFKPGRAYVLEAVARDRRPPEAQAARSAPLVLRVRAVADLALPAGDVRAAAFDQLRRCLGEQVRARAAAGNVRANIQEIRAHRTFAVQAGAAGKAQEAARVAGALAIDAFAKLSSEGAVLTMLKPIVAPGMSQLRDDLSTLADAAGTVAALDGITARQDDLVARLTALLGQLAADARAKAAGPAQAAATPAQEADRKKAEELKKDLERFLDDQRRILERSRSLADEAGADLGADEEKIAGELSRAEKEWAKFLEEKLTNFAQNPPQDFSDASLATETNAVWQDVKLAADALDGKKIELAVPKEQMGIENAEKLVNNLEKWLSDAPDKLKWEMEDAPAPADVALAELPKELEDIVGDLLDKAEEMTDDIQDATSSWNDSLDKGAGWTAADGPISNMSAKGITGNVLPNQSEIGGRSGEGRNGRSNGQMVQDSAVGKGGQETPTRLSQTPFEQGSVKDSSTESGGGATGGGKLSGFDAEGLRGAAPPPQLQQAMARLAGKQQQLQQAAENVALTLRARRMPSGAVESAAGALAAAAEAARRFDGAALKQAHARVLDDLGAARRDITDASQVRRERSRLGDRAREAAAAGADEPVPAGYEDMAGRYFQALAGER